MSAVGASMAVKHSHLKVAMPSLDLPPSIDLQPSPYFRWKGMLDRALAFLLLVPALPLIGLLVLLVRLTSRGPGIYAQVRVGLRGRLFTMYKIRTMRQDAEEGTGPVWTAASDPRVTLVGWVLRKLHLDELPQLFNVIKGQMSLIGPRPERPEFVKVLSEAVPGYLNRLAVRPGVTGMAQLNLPPDTDLASVRRKLVLDCQYIERANLWLDLRVLLATFGRMFKLNSLGLLGLTRNVVLPDHDRSSADSSPAAEDPASAPTVQQHVGPHAISRHHAARNGKHHRNGNRRPR